MGKKSAKKNNKAKAAKKPVKKAKPAAKKKAKKVASKKPAPKKVVKKAKPVAKKVASKKPIKKALAKKPVAKKVAPKKPVKAAKPAPAVKKVAPVKAAKPTPKAVEKAKSAVAQAPYKPAPTPRPRALSQFNEPVKLETIPDYKPEAPAIAKRDVVKPAKGKQKEDKRNRYSEKELSEFKAIIMEKLEQARKDYELLKNTLCHTDDHGTDDTSPTFKMLEDGSDVLTREETAQLALRQEKFIQNLQNALIRIENKTYGICRVTGKLIPKERLRRVPHATLSIDAKMEQQYNA